MALAWEQTRIFLWAIAVGAGIMALYDLFRILRLAFAQREWMIFVTVFVSDKLSKTSWHSDLFYLR